MGATTIGFRLYNCGVQGIHTQGPWAPDRTMLLTLPHETILHIRMFSPPCLLAVVAHLPSNSLIP